jgi:hypothetical protein
MNLTDAGGAAQLLRYALDPGERPRPDSDYRRLLERFRLDTGFAELTRHIAEGLGLYLGAVTPLGLLVSGDVDGPFAVTLDNSGLPLRSGASRLQDRRCFGLVLVAVAAYAYPTGADLVATTNPTVRPEALLRFINTHVDTLVEACDGADDELDAQVGEAARMWRDLPAVLPAERGGLKRDCQRSYVNRTLEYLADQGRARRDAALADERGEAYALNDRFRSGLSEVCETVAFGVLAADGDHGPHPRSGY